MTDVTELKKTAIVWKVMSDALDGYEGWCQMAKAFGIAPVMSEEEYGDCFYGTNASLFLSLWASVCIRNDAALQNAVTMEVIRFYKKAGYSPAYLQENPADYLGEQFRFLSYLASLSCIGEREADALRKRFQNEFTLECVRVLQREVKALPYLPKDLLWFLSIVSDMLEDIPVNYCTSTETLPFTKKGEVQDEDPGKTTHQVSPADCGRKCKFKAEVSEGCVLSARPDKDIPGKHFTGCVRGSQYRQTYLTPKRLRYPMIRRGKRGEGLFRRITWEEAENRIAREMERTLKTYGPGSRFVMHSAGVCAALRGDRFMKDLLALQGGYREFYNFYSASCAEHVLPYVYGTVFCGNGDEQLLHSKLIVLWGHNPADTIWGLDHLPCLSKAKEAGIPIIVIDPRKSATAKVYAEEWIGIRPSTDGALLDALAFEIVDRNLQDQDFLDRFCIGFDRDHMPIGVPKKENYRDYLFGIRDGIRKDASWAEAITGIPKRTITELALRLATTKPCCILPGLGPQRTLNGEQNCRSVAMLACITGNVGIRGGGAGAFWLKEGHRIPYFEPRENPCPGSIPSFLWTKAIDDPESIDEKSGLRGCEKLKTGLKLIFNLAGGMLINQHSDINNTIRILKQEDKAEFLVVSDLFYTPGAKFADLLLPGISFFETENIVGPWLGGDFFLYNEAAIAPLFEGRFEYDWIAGVAKKLGLYEEFSKGRSKREWLKALYVINGETEEQPSFEMFEKEGIVLMPREEEHIAFRRQREEGIPFETPSGKIELFSKRLYERGDPLLPGLPIYTPCEEGAGDVLRSKYPLQLVGYHSRRYCHSIGDQNRKLDAVLKPCLHLHTEDAKERGICDGDLCEVFNDRGRVRISVSVSEDIVKGTAAMCEGAWYTPDAYGTDVRGCINVLTMSHRTTPLAKANPQHTNLVEVKKYEYEETRDSEKTSG